jgi:hypothetical protein
MKGAFERDAETAFRDEIKRMELQAEKLHLLRLVSDFPTVRGGEGLLARRYLTEKAVSAPLMQAFENVFPPAVAALDPKHSSDTISMTSARTKTP